MKLKVITRTQEWKWVMIASKKWEWCDPWEELDFSVQKANKGMEEK